jgi:hypothetical protein
MDVLLHDVKAGVSLQTGNSRSTHDERQYHDLSYIDYMNKYPIVYCKEGKV